MPVPDVVEAGSVVDGVDQPDDVCAAINLTSDGADGNFFLAGGVEDVDDDAGEVFVLEVVVAVVVDGACFAENCGAGEGQGALVATDSGDETTFSDVDSTDWEKFNLKNARGFHFFFFLKYLIGQRDRKKKYL